MQKLEYHNCSAIQTLSKLLQMGTWKLKILSYGFLGL